MIKEIENDEIASSPKLRNIIAFCIFAICNGLPFVAILSAAEDIIKFESGEKAGNQQNATETQQCIPDLGKPRCEKLMSTGAVLLAAVLPALFVKCTGIFFMNHIPFCFRHFLICLLQAASFLIMAFSTSLEMSLIGVMFNSASSGMGEMCFLALTTFYDRSAFTGWSAGAGLSGIIGSFAYSSLTEPKFLGLSSQNALLVMLIVPAVLFMTFWTVLVQSPRVHQPQLGRPSTWIVPIGPIIANKGSKTIVPIELTNGTEKSVVASSGNAAVTQQFSFVQKLKLLKSLIWYMIPMFLIYLLDYTMNSGLLQHIKYDCDHGFGLSILSQFRWFQTIRVLGLLVPRVTLIFMQLPLFVLYLLAFLQAANLVLFYTEALFSFIPHIVMMFGIIFVEGMMAGSVYAFIGSIYRKTSPETREFSMASVTLADTIGIVSAGFLAIWAHNHICQLYPVIFE